MNQIIIIPKTYLNLHLKKYFKLFYKRKRICIFFFLKLEMFN